MDDYVPTNDLERALAAARADPLAWSDFYRRLRSDVVFVGHDESARDGPTPLDENGLPAQLRVPVIEAQGERYTTAFTSRELAIAFLGSELPRFRITGLAVLMFGGGSALYINPGSTLSVVLTREIVAGIADESAFRRKAARAVEIGSLGPLYVSRPPRSLRRIEIALAERFRALPSVGEARIAWVTDESGSAPPHAVVGVEVDGDFGALVGSCDRALNNVLLADIVVDFVLLDDSKLAEEIRSVAPPFYRRG